MDAPREKAPFPTGNNDKVGQPSGKQEPRPQKVNHDGTTWAVGKLHNKPAESPAAPEAVTAKAKEKLKDANPNTQQASEKAKNHEWVPGNKKEMKSSAVANKKLNKFSLPPLQERLETHLETLKDQRKKLMEYKNASASTLKASKNVIVERYTAFIKKNDEWSGDKGYGKEGVVEKLGKGKVAVQNQEISNMKMNISIEIEDGISDFLHALLKNPNTSKELLKGLISNDEKFVSRLHDEFENMIINPSLTKKEKEAVFNNFKKAFEVAKEVYPQFDTKERIGLNPNERKILDLSQPDQIKQFSILKQKYIGMDDPIRY
jgi:hypothetical protein